MGPGGATNARCTSRLKGIGTGARKGLAVAAKWTVRKRDGVWLATDADGHLRYASTTWVSAVDFALLGYFDQTEAQCRAAEIRGFLDRMRKNFPPWGER